MNERHGFFDAIESQQASCVVHIYANTSELLHTQGRFYVAVPSGEGAAIPLETPWKVVPSDAAVGLTALAVNALVGHTDVRALAADVCLKVVSPQVEALLRQNLAPVLKALRYVWIWMLPGRGVSHLPVLSSQTQELVGRVRVETQVGRIWGEDCEISVYSL